MRDPDRIKPFLEEIGKYWSMVPDWRFFQLIENLKRVSEYSDLFYIEDEEALALFKKFFEG